MKTIEQARKNIRTLKEMYNDWDGRDNEVLKSINKMIIMESEFIRDKENDVRLKSYDEVKEALKKCLDMFKDVKPKEELPYKKIEYYRDIKKSTLEKLHKERNEVIDGYVIESFEQTSGYGCNPDTELIITYTKQWI